MQIIFLSGTKCLWLAQYVNKFLVRHKIFGLAQNILRPVKGQGISVQSETPQIFFLITQKIWPVELQLWSRSHLINLSFKPKIDSSTLLPNIVAAVTKALHSDFERYSECYLSKLVTFWLKIKGNHCILWIQWMACRKKWV